MAKMANVCTCSSDFEKLWLRLKGELPFFFVLFFTENVQEGPGGGRGDVAAAERGFALVVAAVANRRQANDQSASEIPDPRVDHRPVFPPSDTHFDEGSAGVGGREEEKKRNR